MPSGPAGSSVAELDAWAPPADPYGAQGVVACGARRYRPPRPKVHPCSQLGLLLRLLLVVRLLSFPAILGGSNIAVALDQLIRFLRTPGTELVFGGLQGAVLFDRVQEGSEDP